MELNSSKAFKATSRNVTSVKRDIQKEVISFDQKKEREMYTSEYLPRKKTKDTVHT